MPDSDPEPNDFFSGTTDAPGMPDPPAGAGDAAAPRLAALEIIGHVLDRRQPLDSVLEEMPSFTGLPSRDRAFVRMMVATTLRRCGQIDELIARGAERADPPRPPQLRNLLRLSAAQIVFMNVPDYAAVDSAVRLAQECGMARQKGFVNAVLRRIAENGRDWTTRQDAPRLNTPEWLMKTWIADYGLRPAAEIAAANLAEAPLDISLKNPAMLAHWAETLGAAVLPTGSLRLAGGGAVTRLPGFEDGMWWVQDAAACLPAQLFGDVAGRAVLDMCAAPGGKTAQLLAMGARVTALDRSSRRLQRMRDNLRRLRLEAGATLATADATSWDCPAPFEYILLDAPCTATGTIRRHPDVLHLKGPQDMARLMAVQEKLLARAVALLAPGGILIYCTCSLQKAEGEAQVAALLAADFGLRRLPLSPGDVGGIDSLITPDGDVRALPFHMAAHGGIDGFYIARLQKIPKINHL